MNDEILLSRLLEGDLPDEEAAELRARIAREPALRARWHEMQALPSALSALPFEAPPARLRASSPPPANRVAAAVLGAFVGLAAGLLVGRLAPPPHVELTEGALMVDGRAQIETPGALVDIVGEARIEVEPIDVPAREGGSEVPMSIPSHAGAAFGGAVLAITVYSGTAYVWPAEGAPLEVAAGETRRIGPATPVVTQSDIPSRQELPPDASPEVLRQRIAELESDNRALRLEAGFANAQLEAIDGQEIPWTGHEPASMQPDAFEASVRAAVQADPRLTVTDIDCSEYPCTAIVSFPPEMSPEDNKAFVESLAATIGGPDASLLHWISQSDDGGTATGLSGFAILPADADGAVTTRLRARMDDAMR